MVSPPTPARPRRAAGLAAPVLVVWLLIAAYALFFSAASLQQHATLHTSAAAMSALDQALWNTLHGRILEHTVGAGQATRLSQHLEPILLPLSLIYLVWDDVRALLILQTLALALGALPVFWIARAVFRGEDAGSEQRAAWVGVAFAAAYLLFPALQAANMAGLHAEPFAVAPWLLAFWAALRGRWRALWLWATVALAVTEIMPALIALLGLYVVLAELRRRAADRKAPRVAVTHGARGGVAHGMALIAVSLAWLGLAMFVTQRSLTGGLIAFCGTPAEWLRNGFAALREAPRIDYLIRLATSVGWLSLLAPEYLLLGLPILVANMFSSFPGAFSGEQHYSALLVSAFIVAAIFGARRLARFVERSIPVRFTPRVSNATFVAAGVAVWLIAWSLGQQADRGWTPLSKLFTWPQRTAHHALLDRFLDQIPPDAAVSASPAVHPHLAHRGKIYVYPTVADATYILVDVTEGTGPSPQDLKLGLETAVSDGEWGIVDAADGFVLLARGQDAAEWPAEFISFASAGAGQPMYPLDVAFGDGLRLVGHDVVDEPRLRLTRFRFYFEVTGPLPQGTTVRYEVRTPGGSVADDSATHPMPALLWLPPNRWQVGDTVLLETVGWYLPQAWAPVFTVEVNGQALPPRVRTGPAIWRAGEVRGNSVLLPAWNRAGGNLIPAERPFGFLEEAGTVFSSAGWTVRLPQWSAPSAIAPGETLPVSLRWQANDPAPADYSVFVHLRDAAGHTVAQGDGPPTWFLPQPASQWSASEASEGVWDVHELAVPSDLAGGTYTLVVGWYDPSTGDRLSVQGALGNPEGDETVLGPVVIDPLGGPRKDALCLMAPASCASLE